MKLALAELLLAAAVDDGVVLTELPTTTLIAATVPADGASRLVLFTAVVSLLTVCSAWVTPAVSWAMLACCEAALLELPLLDRALLSAVWSDATFAAAWSLDCWPRTWAALRFCASVWQVLDDELPLQPCALYCCCADDTAWALTATASLSAVWSLARFVLAVARFCAAVALEPEDWSALSLAWAAARVACACVRADCMVVPSTVASTCPAVTV